MSKPVTQPLRELAAVIAGRRLIAPARIVLDLVAPLGAIASQTVLFFEPLVPSARWRSYLAALADESSWKQLRQVLDEIEC